MPWKNTLKKLAKNPVGAIKNSKYFKRIDTSKVSKSENLFFLVHFGQLGQVHGFINFEKLENNQLCILYTAANKKMPRLVNKNANHLLFQNVFMQKIPLRPNTIKISNFLYMERAYRDIIRKATPKRIFMQSFEVHYALIANIAKELDIELHLIEEGTATYKFNKEGANTSPILDRSEAPKRRAIINTLPVFKKIRPALTAAREFTGVHVAFPELLDQAFNADYFTRFFLYAPGNGRSNISTEKTIRKYDITSEDYIYLSQKYLIDEFLFPREIIDAISRIAANDKTRVIMKLHPKESEKTLKVFRQVIYEKGLQDTIILIEEKDFLVEPCIALIKPRAIIGLTSTALAYSALISKDSKIVSIAPYILNNLDKLYTSITEKNRFLKSNPGINDIKKHLTLAFKFDHIKFVYEEKDLNLVSTTLNNTKLEAEEKKYTRQETLSHICRLLIFDNTNKSKKLFNQFEQEKLILSESKKTRGLVRQKLAFYTANEKRGELANSKDNVIFLYVDRYKNGDFDAARAVLAEIKTQMHKEDIALLNLDADLALALLNRGENEAAYKLIRDNNQAIIDGDKTWLYIAALVYSAQHKYWKAHCHFTWCLPNDTDDIGLKPLYNLLRNANHLTQYENLDNLLLLATKLYAASNVVKLEIKDTLEASILRCAYNNYHDSNAGEFKKFYLKISKYCSRKNLEYSSLKAILIKNLLMEEKYVKAFIIFESMSNDSVNRDFSHLNIYSLYRLFVADFIFNDFMLDQIKLFIKETKVPFEREILFKIFNSEKNDFYQTSRSIKSDQIKEYLASPECNPYIIAIIINFMIHANHINNIVNVFIHLNKELASNPIIQVERNKLN